MFPSRSWSVVSVPTQGGNPPIGKRYRNQWFGSVPRCAIPGVSIVQRTLRPRYRQVWLIALEKRWCKMPTSCQILKATTRELIAGQACCLGHEVILFRDARCPACRNSVVFDGVFIIADHF